MGESRKLKIKIGFTAQYEKDGVAPIDANTLDELITTWYETEGKIGLERYLTNSDTKVKYKSYLNYFQFGDRDSVDKEADLT